MPPPPLAQTELHLLVHKEAAPDVYGLEIDDAVEVGPFQGTGLDLRSSPLMAVYRYPTVRAALSSSVLAEGLSLKLRPKMAGALHGVL